MDPTHGLVVYETRDSYATDCMGMAYTRLRRSARSTYSSVFGMAYTPTGIPRMCKIQADDPSINVSPGDDTSHTQSIKRVEVTKGMRTLGVRLAQHRLEEATKMRDHLKTAPLNRENVAILGFRAIWQMKLKYCLGATCFTKKQCDKLQARFLPTFLSKMGINRTNGNRSSAWANFTRRHAGNTSRD